MTGRMHPRSYELYGVRVLQYAPGRRKLQTERDATDVIGEALSNSADWVVISVECLDDDFFRLSTRIAGGIIQKFVNYRRKLAIIGDVSRFVAESSALRDFIYESNRGDQVWFLPTAEEFEERLKKLTS